MCNRVSSSTIVYCCLRRRRKLDNPAALSVCLSVCLHSAPQIEEGSRGGLYMESVVGRPSHVMSVQCISTDAAADEFSTTNGGAKRERPRPNPQVGGGHDRPAGGMGAAHFQPSPVTKAHAHTHKGQLSLLSSAGWRASHPNSLILHVGLQLRVVVQSRFYRETSSG